MVANVSSHRITYSGLALRGALAGLIAAVLMALLAMVLGPVVDRGSDAFTFLRSIATIGMGESALEGSGFEMAPVLVGAAIHFAVGALMGAVFAMLVGLFDLSSVTEGGVPITLAGIAYGALVFVTFYTIIGQVFFPSVHGSSVLVAFWGHILFGFTAGAMLARWRDRYDEGPARRISIPFDAETAAVGVVGVLALGAVIIAALLGVF